MDDTWRARLRNEPLDTAARCLAAGLALFALVSTVWAGLGGRISRAGWIGELTNGALLLLLLLVLGIRAGAFERTSTRGVRTRKRIALRAEARVKIEIERQPDGVLIAVRTHSRARACWGLAAIPFAILGAIAIDEAAASVALVGATITAALGVLVWTWPRLNVIHASSRGVVWTAYFWGVARRTELGHESVSPVVVSECDVLWRGSIHDVHTFLVFGKAERAFRINAPANRATELAALIEGAVGA